MFGALRRNIALMMSCQFSRRERLGDVVIGAHDRGPAILSSSMLFAVSMMIGISLKLRSERIFDSKRKPLLIGQHPI